MEVIYNPDLMIINDIKLTRNESLILNVLLGKGIVPLEQINKTTKTRLESLAGSVTISRFNAKLKGTLEIKNKWGAGYYIDNKEDIVLKGNTLLLKETKFEDYRLELQNYFTKAFEEYKEEIDTAEKKLKKRLEKVL